MDLFRELAQAAGNIRQSHLDTLIASGISGEALGPGLGGDFGVVRIRSERGFFEPDPEGEGAFIIGVKEGRYAPLADLCAFQLVAPSRWSLRLGQAPVLGMDNIEHAWMCHEPLLIHSTPFAWLQSDCMGAVILDWKANIPLWLGSVKTVVADTGFLAEQLNNAFQRDTCLPDIRVLEEQRHAA